MGTMKRKVSAEWGVGWGLELSCSRWLNVHTKLPGEAKQLGPLGRRMRLWTAQDHGAWPDAVPLACVECSRVFQCHKPVYELRPH